MDARFDRKCRPTASGCIEYDGARHGNGYRNVGRNGKSWLAHRYAWTLRNGAVPDGLMVLHACDNRACVNVDHLFLGTAKDNTRDMMAKGRQKFVGYMSPNNALAKRRSAYRGDAHRQTKYDAETFKTVKFLYGAERVRQCDIASFLGMSQAQVSRIVRGTARQPALSGG